MSLKTNNLNPFSAITRADYPDFDGEVMLDSLRVQYGERYYDNDVVGDVVFLRRNGECVGFMADLEVDDWKNIWSSLARLAKIFGVDLPSDCSPRSLTERLGAPDETVTGVDEWVSLNYKIDAGNTRYVWQFSFSGESPVSCSAAPE